MTNTTTTSHTAHTTDIDTTAIAANDHPTVTTSIGSSKPQAINHWLLLSNLKPRPHPHNPIGIICRAGAPLLSSYLANTAVARFRGLFAFPMLTATQALIIHPCKAVHTVGFKHTIDVVFVDKRGVILKCAQMSPCSICVCTGSRSVIEMAHGTVQRLSLQKGQQLDVQLTGDTHD